MVCSMKAYQLLQMLPCRLDLETETDMEMPLTDHAWSVDPVLLVAQVDAYRHANLSP